MGMENVRLFKLKIQCFAAYHARNFGVITKMNIFISSMLEYTQSKTNVVRF